MKRNVARVTIKLHSIANKFSNGVSETKHLISSRNFRYPCSDILHLNSDRMKVAWFVPTPVTGVYLLQHLRPILQLLRFFAIRAIGERIFGVGV